MHFPGAVLRATEHPRADPEPSPDMNERSVDAEEIERFRGQLFTQLDRLAFALELEAGDAVQAGDYDHAARIEDRRLGVRLAQRLVAGVHADEVDLRIERSRDEYDSRAGGVSD